MRVRLLLLNILLAVLWMFMWNSIDIFTLLFGLALGYLLLGALSRDNPDDGDSYGRKLWSLLSFSFYFIRILIQANLQVVREVCTPGLQMTPRIIKYDVSEMTDVQITTLANSITLTPGTLSIDVSDDSRWLYVHCMYAAEREAAKQKLDELRNRILKDIFG